MSKATPAEKNMNHLFNEIADGNFQAEGEIIEHYQVYTRVQSMVFGRMNNVADSDKRDVVHEVITALILALRAGRYNPERAPFGAFLWGITRNKISLYYKQHSRFGWMSPIADHASQNTPLHVEEEQQSNLLQELLNVLDEKYRQVIELRFFEEMGIEEIADDLGLRQKQVRNRLTYAFQLLRQYAHGEYSTQLQG
ncbi:MAG: RNA polymerase sigma factor [Calditrichia bacterium]